MSSAGFRRTLVGLAFIAGIAATVPAWADPVVIGFNTELMSMNLTGLGTAPLAPDPGNALGDSIDGYGFVNSSIALRLSSSRANSAGPDSLGGACASQGGQAYPPNPCRGAGSVDPDALDGQPFLVNSFFDVFFDLTITDIDARSGRDYAGMVDGASLSLPDLGPVRVTSRYSTTFNRSAPTFGLFPPPEASPLIGYDLVIPLGSDINGNGENDVLKFTLMSFAFLDGNRTFITLPDGTVISQFDTEAAFSGAVLDASADPPFSFQLTGPTTATSRLLVPEPSMLLLVAGGLAMFARRRGRR